MQLLLRVLADERIEDMLRQRIVRREVVIMRIDSRRLGGQRNAQGLRGDRRGGQARNRKGRAEQGCAHDDNRSRLSF